MPISYAFLITSVFRKNSIISSGFASFFAAEHTGLDGSKLNFVFSMPFRRRRHTPSRLYVIGHIYFRHLHLGFHSSYIGSYNWLRISWARGNGNLRKPSFLLDM
jgi:hypothetical protein